MAPGSDRDGIVKEDVNILTSVYELSGITVDNFTLEDRKELIKQTFLLDSFHKEIHDLKVGVRESLLKIDITKANKEDLSKTDIVEHNKRLTSLENDRIRLNTQIKSILWFGGAIITAIQVLVAFALKLYSSK